MTAPVVLALADGRTVSGVGFEVAGSWVVLTASGWMPYAREVISTIEKGA